MKIKLVHGFTQNRQALTPFCDLLQVIADAPVEIIEAPYHGDSLLTGKTLSEVGAEVGRAYRDDECVFVGYSLGGRILLEALSAGALGENDVIVFGAAISEGGVKQREARIEADRKLAERVASIESKEEFREFLVTWLNAPLFNGISHEQAQLEARLNNDPQKIARVLTELSTGHQFELMDRLKVVLQNRQETTRTHRNRLGYVYGGHDIKFKGIASSLMQEIEVVSLIEIGSCGHFTIGERPYESAQAIVKILQGWGKYDK